MEVLKPYRRQIDDLDAQIVHLLKQRYDVIRKVADVKARENIPPFIQERVDEVRENARALAKEEGIDSSFIADLYSQLIWHSCELEDQLIQARQEQPDKKAARA